MRVNIVFLIEKNILFFSLIRRSSCNFSVSLVFSSLTPRVYFHPGKESKAFYILGLEFIHSLMDFKPEHTMDRFSFFNRLYWLQ